MKAKRLGAVTASGRRKTETRGCVCTKGNLNSASVAAASWGDFLEQSPSLMPLSFSWMLKNSCWFGWEEMPLPVELHREQTLWFYRFVLLMLFLFINKRRNRLCLKLPRTWALRCWIYVDKHVLRDGARAVSPSHKAKLKLSFTCSTSLSPGWGCS